MMASWTEFKIGDLITLANGSAIRKRDIQPEGAVAAYGANGMLGFTDKSNVKNRTIAIGRVGSCGAITSIEGPAWISDNVMFVKSKSETIDWDFLFYLLLAQDFTEDIRKGAMPSLSQKPILCKRVAVPLLLEQHRIVARIKKCMELVEEIEALRTESYNECTTVLPAYYHDLYRDLVQRYTSIPLAAAGIVSGGGTPSKKRDDFWNGDIPWISPKEMKRRNLFNATQNITEAAIQGSSTKLIKKHSVLFVVRGMILSHTLPVAVNRVPVTINQDMKAITPRDNIKVDFLAAMLRGSERELLSKVEVAGHGTRRLQTAHWSALPVPIVSEQDQAAIVSEVQNMEEMADALKGDVELDEIHLLRESILRKAFAGEL